LRSGDWATRYLDHRFSDQSLLDAALTHRSAGSNNYERLEFLGDAVLDFVVADLLCRRFPEASEGDLSRYRAALVSGGTLAQVAVSVSLGDQLNLGSGELKSGGYRRDSILADALEAVLAAVYLDGGLDAARIVVERLLASRLDELPDADALKDPKTRIQEALQALGEPLPVYSLEKVSGEPHEQWFVASCEVGSAGVKAFGEGSSRRRAEQEAAQAALEVLGRGKSGS
jgi:ribonuclease-3